MKKEDVKWLHFELSSKCNAWCPACGRNNKGFGLIDGLVEEDLSIERFTEVISQFPNLHAVQLCGNYGDPVMSKHFTEIVDVAKQHVEKIQIHTNGSLRAEQWWTELAGQLKDIAHDVWFGLDGIGDVHEIYRQGTSYDKIIKNATAFINAGGHATWQFIPYAHNEHQIKEAIKQSRALGFKQFKFVKLFRNTTLVRHYRTGEEFTLSPPKEFQTMLRMERPNTTVKLEDCMHVTQPSIYIGANGKLSKCCFFNDAKQFDSLDGVLGETDFTNSVCLKKCGSV